MLEIVCAQCEVSHIYDDHAHKNDLFVMEVAPPGDSIMKLNYLKK